MELWQPEPDETLVARAPISFATGAAAPVNGKRWFRDTARNDVQNELEGWPSGPAYEASSPTASAARQIFRGAVVATGMAIGTFLSMHGGRINGTPGSSPGTDTPEDRADEVDDFPVMWADPGTVARTLPWQLDPARARAAGHRTHAVITDRRLVIVGFDYVKGAHDFIHDDLLWEVPRTAIERVELRNFKSGLDAKIVFTDDSWCRVSSRARERLTRYLIEPLDFIPLRSLSPAQRKTAEEFAARQGPDAQAPLVKRNPCGCFRIEVLAPSKTDVRFGHPGLNSLMDSYGREIPITEYHSQDFLT
ncbi:hypothetical protein AB0900_00615 [Streptomyces cellulosae]|jgi:hypothetical protein|uniref:hypothetical protein n=1 Tax=unclassified Streptomyces TaxID=2593676 RepID=UPI000361E30E|nr:hypothetical protein [Streptomyces sp. McG7]MBT2905843.1 hypothetical protein [Streptomyces sp. McG8]MYW52269.1 hypothetical protein [Streptomyces sp. SID8376]WUC43867.1 hypothetical protein OG692_19160 [Streptomyces cellulosae]